MDYYTYRNKLSNPNIIKPDRKGNFRFVIQGNMQVNQVCVIGNDKHFCGTWLTFRNRDEFNQIKHEYGLTEIYPDNL